MSHEVITVDFVRRQPQDLSGARSASAEAESDSSRITEVKDLGLYEGALRAIVLAERSYLFACLSLDVEEVQAHELELLFRASIDNCVLVDRAAQVVTAIRKYYGYTAERMNEHVAGITEFGMRLEFEAPDVRPGTQGPAPEPDAHQCDVIHWRRAPR